MPIPSGLSAQFGTKSETVVGTPVTVDTFYPLLSFDIKNTADRLAVQGIRAGRRTQYGFKKGKQAVGGTLVTELNNKPMANTMTHLLGTVITTGAGPYVHTATPGALTGKAFTGQGGIPDITGTVNPFTWNGCKLRSATISASMGQIAQLSRDVFAMSEDADGTPSLTAASFLSGIIPFSFVECSITANAVSLGVVSDMSLTIDNGLNDQRFGLGSATAAEALESGLRSFTGTLNVEFLSMVAYNLYLAGTEFALVFTFSNGTDSLVITTNAYYTGETPNVDGPSTLQQSLPFVCQSSTSDAGCITAVLTNGESVAT